MMVPDPVAGKIAVDLGGILTGVTIRKEGTVLLDCLLEQPCPPQVLCDIESSLEKNLPAGEVIIRQRFGQNLDSEKSCHYAAALQPWLLRHLWKTDAYAASMLSHAVFLPGSGQVNIHLHAACCPLFDLTGLSCLEKLFNDHVTAQACFSLQPSDSDMADYVRQMNDGHMQQANQAMACTLAANPVIQDNQPSRHVATRSAPASMTVQPSAPRPFRRQPKPEGLIWGKMRSELVHSPITSLNSESGLVLLEGEVFDFESREINSGVSVLIKFSLTDLDNSIGCVLFVKPDVRDVVEASLKGAWVRVNAEISFDSKFAKDLQARVVGLQTATRQPPRQDLAMEKRIELHAHTKMSTKDSVCSPADLVKLAAEFGQEDRKSVV